MTSTKPGWRTTGIVGICCLILVCLSVTPLSKAYSETPSIIPSFSAVYTLKRNGTEVGTSTRSLRTTPQGSYIYESTTQATGIVALFIKDFIEERSVWVYEGNHLRPLEYIYNRQGGLKTRSAKLTFDWQRKTVTNNIDGDAWHMEIPPDTYDKLVYQLAIMHDLQIGSRNLVYNIADGGVLKNYTFEIIGEETRLTMIGKQATVKIRRVDDKRNTIVWCAKTLSYLPVRIVQIEPNGDELGMDIESVQGFSKIDPPHNPATPAIK